jgi:hypothetical protein
MSRYQRDIIWIGLILIVLNIIVNIGDVKSIIFGGPSGNAPAKPTGPTPVPSTPKPSPAIAPGQLPIQPQQTPPGTSVV